MKTLNTILTISRDFSCDSETGMIIVGGVVLSAVVVAFNFLF